MENLPEFTSEPGLHHVNTQDYAEALFALDCKIASGDNMVAFGAADELVSFFAESDTYVLNDTSRAVGLLAVTAVSDVKLEVLSIGVIPEAQGEGHGKTMMLWVEELAKHTGRSVIELVTKTSNRRAIAFYEHLGYEQKEVIARYYSDLNDNEDRVRLEKQLEKYVQAS